jgi:hypothetical protein
MPMLSLLVPGLRMGAGIPTPPPTVSLTTTIVAGNTTAQIIAGNRYTYILPSKISGIVQIGNMVSSVQAGNFAGQAIAGSNQTFLLMPAMQVSITSPVIIA